MKRGTKEQGRTGEKVGGTPKIVLQGRTGEKVGGTSKIVLVGCVRVGYSQSDDANFGSFL